MNSHLSDLCTGNIVEYLQSIHIATTLVLLGTTILAMLSTLNNRQSHPTILYPNLLFLSRVSARLIRLHRNPTRLIRLHRNPTRLIHLHKMPIRNPIRNLIRNPIRNPTKSPTKSPTHSFFQSHSKSPTAPTPPLPQHHEHHHEYPEHPELRCLHRATLRRSPSRSSRACRCTTT